MEFVAVGARSVADGRGTGSSPGATKLSLPLLLPPLLLLLPVSEASLLLLLLLLRLPLPRLWERPQLLRRADLPLLLATDPSL